MDTEELKMLICSNLDVVEFLDVINLELVDLVELEEIRELIEEHREALSRAVRE
jgi:benzoyl-CoA reductase/2-hydroxyglutaryl-CoA dehydratase subunit BcrC/BadD/HgdB